MRRELPAYRPYPRRLENLTICRCNYEGALSPQLFKDPECWSGRSRTHDLPRDSPVLNQLSHRCAVRCIQQLQQVLHDKATAFVNLTWFHLYEIFNDQIIENADEVIVNISRGGFTECTAKLHQFLNSPQFQQYTKALFTYKVVR